MRKSPLPKNEGVLPAYAPLRAHSVASRLLGDKKHKGMIRGFHHAAEAWYANTVLSGRTDAIVDDVTIGFFGADGTVGTTGEFKVRWENLGGKIHPRLCVYDDAWEALAHFSDLLARMSSIADPTPKAFCELLKELGIKDLTRRKQP